jgi:hypothetical protein
MISKLMYLVGVSLLVIAIEGFGYIDITPYTFDFATTIGGLLFGVVLVIFGRGVASVGY